ncbi:MAG: hypothetical protein J5864_06990 [Oscillospiraceae bacterium]|nr:hypothetical protein [Oscillospiraceae bacterium]
MKTLIIRVAVISGLAALIPATFAISAYASEINAPENPETVVTEESVVTEADDDTAIEITKTITVSDDGTDDTNEAVYYCCTEDGDTVERVIDLSDGCELSFVIGFDEMEPDAGFDVNESENTKTLTADEADSLAKEKLTDEQYARWQELTAEIDETAFGEDEWNSELLNEITELLSAMTDSEAKWTSINYTFCSDNNDTAGVCVITDVSDDGIVNTENTVYVYDTEE